MMKVIPVPRATIARVESGAEGERETLRKTGWEAVRMGKGEAQVQGVDRFPEGEVRR